MLALAGAPEDEQLVVLQRSGLTFTQAQARLSQLPPPKPKRKGRRKLAERASGPDALGENDPIGAMVQRAFDGGLHEQQVGALLMHEFALSNEAAAREVCFRWPGGLANSRLPHVVAARASEVS
jgi:hypothetical protein